MELHQEMRIIVLPSPLGDLQIDGFSMGKGPKLANTENVGSEPRFGLQTGPERPERFRVHSPRQEAELCFVCQEKVNSGFDCQTCRGECGRCAHVPCVAKRDETDSRWRGRCSDCLFTYLEHRSTHDKEAARGQAGVRLEADSTRRRGQEPPSPLEEEEPCFVC